MPYNDLSNSEQSTPSEFQPEVGLYDEDSFAQSQYGGSNGPVSIVNVEPRLIADCSVERSLYTHWS